MKKLLIIVVITVVGIFSDGFTAYSQTASSMVVTRTRVKKAKDPIKIKWQNNIDATISQYYAVTYTGGWRFGNFMFLGFGTGVQVHHNAIPWDENGTFIIKGKDKQEIRDMIQGYDYYNSSRLSVPVYAQVRFRFMRTKVAPYLAASGGAMFNGYCYHDSSQRDYDSESGYYYNESIYKKDGAEVLYFGEVLIGVDFKLKNNSSISLGLGPFWTGQRENYLYEEEDGEGRAIGGFKLGYSF